MVCASFSLGEGTLEGVGYVCLLHEMHESGVKDAGEQFAETAGNRYWTVVCRNLFRSPFMEGCDICRLPWGWEVRRGIYSVE